MDRLDEMILDIIQDEFPVASSPYEEIARRAETSPEEAERRVAAMRRDGVIRRLGAVVDSRALGMATTLAATDVEPGSVDEVASQVGRFREVTHSYLRKGHPNIWFTLVARSRERIDELMDEVRALEGVRSALELPATRVFKLAVRVKFSETPEEERPVSPRPPGQSGEEPASEGSAAPLSDADRAILRELSGGIPEGARPYARIATRAGLGEEEVLAGIRGLLDRGILRRVAAVLHDRKLGYDGNAMVVWCVPDEKLDQAGEAAAARPEISHAYARKTAPDWPYNFYTMIHARSREGAEAVAKELAASIGATDYKPLFTLREFTKRPPDYSDVLGG